MSQNFILAGGQAAGVAGMIADSCEIRDIVSGFNKDAALQQIPFGYAVMHAPGNTDERAYSLPTGTTGTVNIDGISVFDLNHSRAGAVDPNGNYSGDMGASGLLPNASMQIARRGRYFVPVENAVINVNDRAYVRIIPTGIYGQGLLGNTNVGSGYHKDITSQAVFRSKIFTAADNSTNIAILECDFVNKATISP